MTLIATLGTRGSEPPDDDESFATLKKLEDGDLTWRGDSGARSC